MQRKMQALFSLVAIVSVFGLTSGAQAASNWKEYFTLDEGKALKKLVDKYVREQLEEGDDNWEGIISKDSVDGSIAKKKVITGSITCDESFADKTTFDDDGSPDFTGDDVTHYYKKISFDGISLNEPAVIQLYKKLASDEERAQLDSNIWSIGTPYVSNGEAWVQYGYKNIADYGDVVRCDTTDYKLVINY